MPWSRPTASTRRACRRTATVTPSRWRPTTPTRTERRTGAWNYARPELKSRRPAQGGSRNSGSGEMHRVYYRVGAVLAVIASLLLPISPIWAISEHGTLLAQAPNIDAQTVESYGKVLGLGARAPQFASEIAVIRD